MKTKRMAINPTTAVETFRAKKQRDRLVLARRIDSGELPARRANEEASIFQYRFDPARAVIDWKATFASLRRLPLHERSTRNAKKTVHA